MREREVFEEREIEDEGEDSDAKGEGGV